MSPRSRPQRGRMCHTVLRRLTLNKGEEAAFEIQPPAPSLATDRPPIRLGRCHISRIKRPAVRLTENADGNAVRVRRRWRMARVFISYATPDRDIGEAACSMLESTGIDCWMAPRDILPGASWGEAIVRGINESSLMVVVFSSHSNASNQVEREVERAVHRRIPIVVLRVEALRPTGALEYFLSTHHWLDAFGGNMTQALQRLADTIAGTADAPAPTPAGHGEATADSERLTPMFEEVLPDDWGASGRGSTRWLRRLFQDR
jgi:hypothetical protein